MCLYYLNPTRIAAYLGANNAHSSPLRTHQQRCFPQTSRAGPLIRPLLYCGFSHLHLTRVSRQYLIPSTIAIPDGKQDKDGVTEMKPNGEVI